ncbi:MAG: Bug family tripartite tricarboxylate transporter substrate binding protein, partial [Rubrivivax sp.]
MLTTTTTRRAWVAATLLLAAAGLQAQLDRPVKILVGFPPGGSADVAARLLAERMAADLKQPVVVENKPGAGGRIAAELLKSAPADGSTLMLAPIVVPVLAPMVFSKLNYEPASDFAPVAAVANFQFGVAVNAAHPAKTLPELVAWYRGNEKAANFGSPAPGSLPHFFGTMLARGAGVDLVHVPFAGGAPLINALVGNQVTAGIDVLAEQVELHRSGKLRVLATSGAARSPLLPDVPTATEAGLRGVEGSGWFAVYAPAKAPEPTLRALNAAINKALADASLRERFAKLGLEPSGGSAADLAATMQRD